MKIFCISDIKSVITYAAPASYTLLTNQSKLKLQAIERTATVLILPKFDYKDRLLAPCITGFLFKLPDTLFNQI